MLSTDIPQPFPFARDARCPFEPPREVREPGQEPKQVTIWNGRTAWLVTRHSQVQAILSDPRASHDIGNPGYPHESEPFMTRARLAPAGAAGTEGSRSLPSRRPTTRSPPWQAPPRTHWPARISRSSPTSLTERGTPPASRTPATCTACSPRSRLPRTASRSPREACRLSRRSAALPRMAPISIASRMPAAPRLALCSTASCNRPPGSTLVPQRRLRDFRTPTSSVSFA